MPEVEISRHDVISDVRRVLALTKSPEMPEGDLRISTYLEVGRYSRSTIYKHFRGWQELLASIFGTPKTERYLHVTVPKRQYTKKKRTCLGCDRDFMSWGAENRLCERCRQSKVYLEGDEDLTFPLYLPMEGLST